MNNSPLSDYLLGEILSRTRSLESDIREIKAKLGELTTWSQRASLLAALWAVAVGINFAPEKVGEMLAALLKSLK